MYCIFSVTNEGHFDCNNFHPLHVAVKRSGQWRTSSSHGKREQSTEKHQPVSEGISWEPHIRSAHTSPPKIANKISFQVTKNDTMVQSKFNCKRDPQILTSPFSISLNVPTFPKTSDLLYFVQTVGGVQFQVCFLSQTIHKYENIANVEEQLILVTNFTEVSTPG